MRIVFDGRSIFPGMGGIGRAAAALARELPAALGPDAELTVLVGQQGPPRDALPEGCRVYTTGAAMIDPGFEQFVLPGLLSKLGADLYHNHCFSVPVPLGGVCRVATVHDVVFRRHPELVDAWLRDYLDRWTRVSCELADAIVTVSDFSSREITELYGLPESFIHVIPNAVDPKFWRIKPVPASPPYVLYVGALEPKKNVAALIEAFAALPPAGSQTLSPRLVLVGGGGGASFDVHAHIPEAIAERVHVLGYVDEANLEVLYAGASVFCYLSEYEGFGLPPLEAMAAGVPCVVADRASLPEVTRGAAWLVDPADPDDVSGALSTLLEDADARAELTERGWSAARATSWTASAATLADLYRHLLALDTFPRSAS